MRIDKATLAAMTPEQWYDWYHAQTQGFRAEIGTCVEALITSGFTHKEAMLTTYALVEEFKMAEFDKLNTLPATYRN